MMLFIGWGIYGVLSVVILFCVSEKLSVLMVVVRCLGFVVLMIGVVIVGFVNSYVSVMCVCGIWCVLVICVMMLIIFWFWILVF